MNKYFRIKGYNPKDLENLINHNYQTTYNIKNSSKILKSSYKKKR